MKKKKDLHQRLERIERLLGLIDRDKVNEIDWSSLPDWVQYVAKDEDGSTWVYSHEPARYASNGCWKTSGKLSRIKLDIPDGDWKESLLKRPEKCTCSIVEVSPGNPKFCQCERCENEEKKYNQKQRPEPETGETERVKCEAGCHHFTDGVKHHPDCKKASPKKPEPKEGEWWMCVQNDNGRKAVLQFSGDGWQWWSDSQKYRKEYTPICRMVEC